MGLLWSDNSVKITHKHPEKIINEERRAFTDDSIRLAREYEEKIYSQVAEKLMVTNNLCNFTIAFSHDYLMHQRMLIKIRINEKDYSETFNIYGKTLDDVLQLLRNWISDKVLLDPIREVCLRFISGQVSGYAKLD